MISKHDILIDRLRAMKLNCNEIKTFKDDNLYSKYKINNQKTKLTISDIQFNLLSTEYSKELLTLDFDNLNSLTLNIKKVLIDNEYYDVIFKLVQDVEDKGNFLLLFKMINKIAYDDATGMEYYVDY